MSGNKVSVLFSDLDGTLVHYPKEFLHYAQIIEQVAATEHSPEFATIRYNDTNETRKCVVLPSMTGGKAYLSLRTKELVARLREMGVIFVIITGARSSTYVSRRASLPAADYEFYENGGRKIVNGQLDASWSEQFKPQVGEIGDRVSLVPDMPPPNERDGTLWKLYDELVAQGWSTDSRQYSTNFRVDVAKSDGKTAADFAAIVADKCAALGLASSYNLGKADLYPAASGKANAARHVLHICGIARADAVAIFDDDNDLELGALCGRGFLPGVTHESVLAALKEHAEWSVSKRMGFLGTEEALEKIVALRSEALSASSV
ncbi:haloacid dehalogenase-like hydrolase [Gracilaria domingensis]|nr:haloacid dehalogenase-like hydrolase [Gracilaria domingensis]